MREAGVCRAANEANLFVSGFQLEQLNALVIVTRPVPRPASTLQGSHGHHHQTLGMLAADMLCAIDATYPRFKADPATPAQQASPCQWLGEAEGSGHLTRRHHRFAVKEVFLDELDSNLSANAGHMKAELQPRTSPRLPRLPAAGPLEDSSGYTPCRYSKTRSKLDPLRTEGHISIPSGISARLVIFRRTNILPIRYNLRLLPLFSFHLQRIPV